MIIFLDFETTGLIPQLTKNDGRKVFYPYYELEKYNESRAVQFSFVIYHNDGRLDSLHDYIIKPNGFIIPQESTNIHHISHNDAIENGVDINEALNVFENYLDNCRYLVMHNAWFDRNILLSEIYRLNNQSLLNKVKNIDYFCTMRGNGIKDYCGIRSQYYNGYKNPTLGELHYKLFNEKVNTKYMHNALTDAKITAKCFFALLKKGIIR